MPSEKDRTRRVDRRNFLKQASLAIGSAGLAGTVGSSETVAAAAEDTQAEASGGYRETEHVRTYYKLAQF